MPVITQHTQEVEREGDTFDVTVTVEWAYEQGIYLEAGHPMNGIDAGWHLSRLSAVRDDTEQKIVLTDFEYREAVELAARERENQN